MSTKLSLYNGVLVPDDGYLTYLISGATQRLSLKRGFENVFCWATIRHYASTADSIMKFTKKDVMPPMYLSIIMLSC